MRLSRLRLAAALPLLLALLAGSVHAQAPNTAPTVTLELDVTVLSLGAGNATEVAGTVRNAGSLDGTVTLSIEGLEGWDATLEPASAFTLAAGASAPVTLALTAPAPGAGTANGTFTLTATLQDVNGLRSDAATATLAVTRVDPIVPPPPPPPYGLYAALAGGATALVATGVVLYARKRRLERQRAEEARRQAEHEAYLARETGVGIKLLEGPSRFGTRRELVFRLAVENQSQRERVAVFGVVDCPEGWTAASAISQATLPPGERTVVTFYANPSDAIPGGAKATLTFFAKPEEARELDQRVRVEIEAPQVRVPELGERQPTLHREPVPPRPSLRF